MCLIIRHFMRPMSRSWFWYLWSRSWSWSWRVGLGRSRILFETNRLCGRFFLQPWRHLHASPQGTREWRLGVCKMQTFFTQSTRFVPFVSYFYMQCWTRRSWPWSCHCWSWLQDCFIDLVPCGRKFLNARYKLRLRSTIVRSWRPFYIAL